MLKLATAFSGIGAVEHALYRMAIPYEIVFASDCDKFVKQSYFANYDINDHNWYDMVENIDGNKYKNHIDLLVGGTPCQSFSMVGKRKGFADKRGNLFYEFIRLIEEIQPKMFIFENVKGLISHDKGDTWKTIQKAFDGLGYSFSYSVMNAKNFGIPQNRERLFVVGSRDKNNFIFPNPVPLYFTMKDFLDDEVESKYFLPEKGIKFVTNDKNLKKKYTQIDGAIALCQKANQQFNWHGDFVISIKGHVDNKYFLSKKVKKYVLSPGTKNFYSKPEIDLKIARPILSTMSKMHRAGVDNYISRGKHIRRLTPRECLRLMGFDDTFNIIVSDTQMYRQAGNSIVVNVLMHILNNMEVINQKYNNNNPAEINKNIEYSYV